MNEKIIFSQSPVDIRHVLSFYEQYRGKTAISIYVTNIYNNFRFLKSLGLKDCSLTYVPYRDDYRTPLGAVGQRRELHRLYRERFAAKEGAEVYFFTYYFDWAAFFFLKRLSKKNVVRLIDVYGYHRMKSSQVSFVDRIKRIALLYITGVFFDITDGMNERIIAFPYRRFGIRESKLEIDPDALRGYMYRVGEKKQKNMLFFESNGAENDMFVGYEDKLKEVVSGFDKAGWTVYVKPHPRLGYSKLIDDLPAEVIEEYIPAELVDIGGFDAVCGINSMSIANIARGEAVCVVSLLDLFRFKEEEVREGYREYLIEKGSGRVRFAANLSELLDKVAADKG